MHVIEARNVHQALPLGLETLKVYGQRRESRNGPVLVMPGPVTTRYRQPLERVVLWPERDCNPFFHLYEGLWMLAGRNDVASVAAYVRRMASFSDDGKTLHGAYGHRWRRHFGIDQLSRIITTLRDSPEDRRCVLQMWDAVVDLERDGRDIPCNTHVYFSRRSDGALDMTVCCRSNDVIWGAYGANAVHFSMLQEYVAAGIGCAVGEYWQISNNYHAYLDTYEPLRELAYEAADPYRTNNCCPYATGEVEPFPMISTPVERWRQELDMILDEGLVIGFRDPFFRRVVFPMLRAWQAYKSHEPPDRYHIAWEILDQCKASDWRTAGVEWIYRRHLSWNKAMDDGPQHKET